MHSLLLAIVVSAAGDDSLWNECVAAHRVARSGLQSIDVEIQSVNDDGPPLVIRYYRKGPFERETILRGTEKSPSVDWSHDGRQMRRYSFFSAERPSKLDADPRKQNKNRGERGDVLSQGKRGPASSACDVLCLAPLFLSRRMELEDLLEVAKERTAQRSANDDVVLHGIVPSSNDQTPEIEFEITLDHNNSMLSRVVQRYQFKSIQPPYKTERICWVEEFKQIAPGVVFPIRIGGSVKGTSEGSPSTMVMAKMAITRLQLNQAIPANQLVTDFPEDLPVEEGPPHAGFRRLHIWGVGKPAQTFNSMNEFNAYLTQFPSFDLTPARVPLRLVGLIRIVISVLLAVLVMLALRFRRNRPAAS